MANNISEKKAQLHEDFDFVWANRPRIANRKKYKFEIQVDGEPQQIIVKGGSVDKSTIFERMYKSISQEIEAGQEVLVDGMVGIL